MNLVKSNKKSFILFGAALAAATLVYALLLTGTELNGVAAAHAFSANAELASTLGISTAAAKKAIDIIDAASTIASIISLIGIVTGAGAISYAIVATAKTMIKKYGKKYAAAW
ncbi:uberolysin/carnocyclin family circular bacteriocin [Bacillus siamensis]|uniref:uberolysin/carnocyclin family circular bacteriocin n=1 Tax=Bacillus siamensis TaxID=659243 RepID=UPI0018E6530E|nr:uberolysin/carnocyclin family circular bacteriocin [Bacillus siamensis]QQD81308.1 uberolysin/carnocyclin family circular bacteriocin [Bacillus siamensis]